MDEMRTNITTEVRSEKGSSSRLSEIEKILLDNKVRKFLFSLYIKLRENIEDYKIVTDKKFSPESESFCNHYLLLKLKSGKWIHVKVYTQHMVEVGETNDKEIFVSLREKEDDNYERATHLPLHRFCPWDVEYVSAEVRKNIEDRKL